MRVIIFIINLSLRFISRFGRFHEDFTLSFRVASPKLHVRLSARILLIGRGTVPSSALRMYHSLSIYPLHLSLSLISPSLSISLLLSIILFGVSNGRFRPCFQNKKIFKFLNFRITSEKNPKMLDL